MFDWRNKELVLERLDSVNDELKEFTQNLTYYSSYPRVLIEGYTSNGFPVFIIVADKRSLEDGGREKDIKRTVEKWGIRITKRYPERDGFYYWCYLAEVIS